MSEVDASPVDSRESVVNHHLRRAVTRLNERYLAALDGKDMLGWLACFANDGAYFVQGADNAVAGLPLCLMFDDCYERLQDRVTFVKDIWPGAFEDYQTRHFVQPLSLEPCDTADDLYSSQMNVQILSSDQRGRTSIFVTGTYVDIVRIDDVATLTATFKERRVLLDTFTTPGVVVYPL